MKDREWKEFNIEENYIIFKDNPKTKVPIEDGEIKLDMEKKVLRIKYRLKNEH